MANGVSTRWRGRETQRARRGEDRVVLCLMLDAFLLLTAAEIWHEQSLLQNAAPLQGLSCSGRSRYPEPWFHLGRAEQLIQQLSLQQPSHLSSSFHVLEEEFLVAHAEGIRQQLSESSQTGNYWPFNLEAEGGDST